MASSWKPAWDIGDSVSGWKSLVGCSRHEDGVEYALERYNRVGRAM